MINNTLSVLDDEVLQTALVSMVLVFVFFVLSVTAALVGKIQSTLILFETELGLTLLIMLFLIGSCFGCHFGNNKIKSLNHNG